MPDLHKNSAEDMKIFPQIAQKILVKNFNILCKLVQYEAYKKYYAFAYDFLRTCFEK